MGATPIRSFRLDENTWTEFSDLCKDAKSTPSAFIIGYIHECIRRKSVTMSEDDFAPDPVATAIEQRLIATFESRYGLVPLAGSEDVTNSTYSTNSDENEESEDDSEEITDSTNSTDNDNNEEMTDSTNSIDSTPIESVSSSSGTLPGERLEPKEPSPHQEPTEEHPPEATEAIGNESEENEEIAALCESGSGEGTEGAIALKPGELPYGPEGFTQRELTGYLEGVGANDVSRYQKDPEKFATWSASKGPLYRPWEWNKLPQRKARYFLVDVQNI